MRTALSNGVQPKTSGSGRPSQKPESLYDGGITTIPINMFDEMTDRLLRYKELEEQVRAALRVYESDKTFNSTSLVMADKLYAGLNALEGRGS